MSIDSSLKIASGLSQHRNVLTRAERVKKLADKGLFDLQSGSPTGMPKVGNRKVGGAAKPKKEAKAEEAAAGAKAPAAGAKAPAGKAPAAKK